MNIEPPPPAENSAPATEVEPKPFSQNRCMAASRIRQRVSVGG